MKEKIMKFALWLIENNDELRAKAITILADDDIGVIANVAIHGDYYFKKETISQKVVVNTYFAKSNEILPSSFEEIYQ